MRPLYSTKTLRKTIFASLLLLICSAGAAYAQNTVVCPSGDTIRNKALDGTLSPLRINNLIRLDAINNPEFQHAQVKLDPTSGDQLQCIYSQNDLRQPLMLVVDADSYVVPATSFSIEPKELDKWDPVPNNPGILRCNVKIEAQCAVETFVTGM